MHLPEAEQNIRLDATLLQRHPESSCQDANVAQRCY